MPGVDWYLISALIITVPVLSHLDVISQVNHYDCLLCISSSSHSGLGQDLCLVLLWGFELIN